MIRQFIVQCLFFKSTESIHWAIGILLWISIFLFIYAVVNGVKTWA